MLHKVKTLLLLLFMVPATLCEGANTRTISPEQWRQLTNDKAFDYKNLVEAHQAVKDTHKPGAFLRGMEKVIRLLTSDVVQVIIWTIVALVAIYIVYKLILSNEGLFSGRRKKIAGNDGEYNGVEIEGNNWEALLQNAVAGNDLKAAVRYSYMWLLQLLQEGELISYREDKTNFDYYRELQNTAYKQSFRQLSRQYEYVIYGNYTPTPVTYNRYIDLFNQVKTQLGR